MKGGDPPHHPQWRKVGSIHMELSKEFRFEAAHVLPRHPGKCSRLHGHSWILHVHVEGTVDPETGFVMDYGDISSLIKPLIEMLDHRFLGEYGPFLNDLRPFDAVPGFPIGFYPSSENLLLWIARWIDDALPWSKLTLNETCTSSCTLTRKEYDELRRRETDAARGSMASPQSA